MKKRWVQSSGLAVILLLILVGASHGTAVYDASISASLNFADLGIFSDPMTHTYMFTDPLAPDGAASAFAYASAVADDDTGVLSVSSGVSGEAQTESSSAYSESMASFDVGNLLADTFLDQNGFFIILPFVFTIEWDISGSVDDVTTETTSAGVGFDLLINDLTLNILDIVGDSPDFSEDGYLSFNFALLLPGCASFDLGMKVTAEGSASAAPVPEPSAVLLLGLGLVGLAAYGRRKSRK